MMCRRCLTRSPLTRRNMLDTTDNVEIDLCSLCAEHPTTPKWVEWFKRNHERWLHKVAILGILARNPSDATKIVRKGKDGKDGDSI